VCVPRHARSGGSRHLGTDPTHREVRPRRAESIDQRRFDGLTTGLVLLSGVASLVVADT
jgi:hypothetical protein